MKSRIFRRGFIRGEGLASYLLALAIVMVLFAPLIISLQTSGVKPVVNGLTNFLGQFQFPSVP